MTLRIALAALPAVLSISFIAYRIFGVSVNHIGFTPHYLDILSIASVLLALALKVSRPALWAIVLLAALNNGIVVWAIQSHNFLEYEDWIKRGMPNKTTGRGAP